MTTNPDVPVTLQKPLPAGAYAGVIVDVASHKFEPSTKFGHEDDGKRIKFVVRILPKQGEPRELNAFASVSWTPKSKLVAWVTGLTGHAPDLFKAPDLVQLIGLEFQVVLKVSDDGNYNRVEALLPLPQ
ncbi:MAG: hypothetical protein IMZ46_20930 [Acidobacteria bacterium]|nr:hypothetical protein [Acidobacteriota bacterium]